jgi:hypothetical protein
MTSVFAVLDDQEDANGAFHLPVFGLYADLELAQGSVSLPDEFLGLGAAAQAAILQDWQRALEVARRRALMNMFADVSASMPGQALPARWRRLREECARIGVDCPAELPVPMPVA